MKLKKIYCIILALVFVGVTGVNAGTPKDGMYYFNQMKDSVIEILEENQILINTKPDGSMKTEKLKPEAVYKRAYKMFKKIVGKDFSLKQLKGETNPEKIAPVLASLLQGGRVTIAKAQKYINTEPDGTVKLKKFVPAVFGRITIDRFTKKTGVPMKQTSLSREGFPQRNPYNAPNEWEAKILNKFLEPGWELNKGIGVFEENEYRYVKPIYVKKGCLVCHGKPIGEKGPYGHPREGYKLGDIRGGISVALPSH
ncbi:MAG: DUF3365 domain-containing protein [Desulfobacterales bacterium]|nr:DUF3365 domain-containing protein [Desulfobacterales bacterium]